MLLVMQAVEEGADSAAFLTHGEVLKNRGQYCEQCQPEMLTFKSTKLNTNCYQSKIVLFAWLTYPVKAGLFVWWDWLECVVVVGLPIHSNHGGGFITFAGTTFRVLECKLLDLHITKIIANISRSMIGESKESLTCAAAAPRSSQDGQVLIACWNLAGQLTPDITLSFLSNVTESTFSMFDTK